MQILHSVLCLLVQNAVVSATNDIHLPSSQFTYEYDVLQKLLMLSKEIEMLKKADDVQRYFNNRLQTDLAFIKESKKASDGSVYIRWGRGDCPGNGTELVYRGYGAGSYYNNKGGPANNLCLPEDPHEEDGGYNDSCKLDAVIHGMEYETSGGFLSNLHDQDVPCAVCRSNRPSMIMIPGRNICYDSWTLEYAGYLVAGNLNHPSSSEYICLDKAAEALNGGSAQTDGKLLYIVEAYSGALKCPPYTHCREVFCSVCTK